jgi:hypothetical protein
MSCEGPPDEFPADESDKSSTLGTFRYQEVYDDQQLDESFSDNRPAIPQTRSLSGPASLSPVPGIPSSRSIARAEYLYNLSGEDGQKKSGAQKSQRLEERLIYPLERSRERESLKREKELLKRERELLKREDEHKRRRDHEPQGANRIRTSSSANLKHYEYGLPLSHSHHEVSSTPQYPYPPYPPPTMPPAYIPESGVARSRSTDLYPGRGDFLERFVEMHDRGSRQAVKCTLHMRDIFGEFSASELDGDSVWDLVVLIGQPDDGVDEGPWATTCSEYVTAVWPHSPKKIKDMFMLLGADSGNVHTKSELISGAGGDVLVSTSQHLSIDGQRELSVSFDGRAESQADMVESLTWLFAVLQSGADDERPIASGIEWSRRRSDHVQARDSAYELSNDLLEPLLVPYYSACWTPLLPRTACAVDFETRRRPRGMQGLDVSFDLMCFLSGLEYEIVENEGLILYGQVSSLYFETLCYKKAEHHAWWASHHLSFGT